jgi:hypothetical protein
LFAASIQVKTQEVTNDPNMQGAGTFQEELSGGNWVLTQVDAKSYNGVNVTKWNSTASELIGECSWKDVLTIVHTVISSFKWQDPPKMMQPNSYLNLEVIYTNVDYSTTANVNTGVKIFFEKVGASYLAMGPGSVEVLKLNKDNKQYTNEVKKGFFYAPKTFFDNTNQCQLIVDCYVGKDHYVTTYTYTYQP